MHIKTSEAKNKFHINCNCNLFSIYTNILLLKNGNAINIRKCSTTNGRLELWFKITLEDNTIWVFFLWCYLPKWFSTTLSICFEYGNNRNDKYRWLCILPCCMSNIMNKSFQKKHFENYIWIHYWIYYIWRSIPRSSFFLSHYKNF